MTSRNTRNNGSHFNSGFVGSSNDGSINFKGGSGDFNFGNMLVQSSKNFDRKQSIPLPVGIGSQLFTKKNSEV